MGFLNKFILGYGYLTLNRERVTDTGFIVINKEHSSIIAPDTVPEVADDTITLPVEVSLDDVVVKDIVFPQFYCHHLYKMEKYRHVKFANSEGLIYNFVEVPLKRN